MEKFVAWCIDTAKWVAVCTLMVSVLLAMFIFLPPARAENDFVDAIGKVLVDEEIDGVLYSIEKYDSETWIIPVETKFGVIRFYADNPNWEGKVYLLLFGEDLEVIDAFMVNDLEAPFGELSIFLFLWHPWD